MARALTVNGANKIFILGRREEALLRTQSSLPAEHAKVIIPIACDVTSKDSVSSAYQTITQTHATSTLDVLICNSGTNGPPVPTSTPNITIAELCTNMLNPTSEAITNTYDVNLTGVHLTVATFLPLLEAANTQRGPHNPMTTKPRPQIITTSSIGGLGRRPLANLSYGPSKAALIHMTKMFSTMLIPFDIRANTIAPGLFMSDMTAGLMDLLKLTAETHNVEGNIDRSIVPAMRGGDEQDIAGVILWLCGRAGAYVNGCVVVVDGGRNSGLPSVY